jgi:Concanavalin A-like lectin/glucanases superfamily
VTDPGGECSELRDLLEALCEETITADQMRRLEDLILASPEAEAFYVQYVSMHADLHRHFVGRVAGPPTERSEARPAGPAFGDVAEPRTSRRRLLLGQMAVAAAVASAVLAAVGLWLRPAGPEGVAVGNRAERTDDSVAILLQAPGAVWDDNDVAPRVGEPLRPGWLHLKSGAAHIEFYSGATVILQGPAEFQLVSRTRANCTWGKLRATVPPEAQGFAIGAPHLDLVDRGTEVGLRIGDGKATEVQVFQGKVDLYAPGNAHVGPPKQALTTGQGVLVDGPGTSRPVAPTPAEFLTSQDLADRSRQAIRQRQATWAAETAKLRQDPFMVVYYPFEAAEAWSRTLSDQARGRQQPKDGAIVGCTWAEGRWPGKKGLEFKRVSDRVRLTVPGDFDAVTLAAWVRVDALPNQNNSLFMADKWTTGGLHWQIGQEGNLILGVRSPAGVANAHYRAEGVFTPDRLGLWSFLAVVYDRAGGRVAHYLDGQPVSREALQVDQPVRFGTAELGNWNSGTHMGKDPIRYLTGCIDEFLMFDKPLEDAEIERLYEHGRPPF